MSYFPLLSNPVRPNVKKGLGIYVHFIPLRQAAQAITISRALKSSSPICGPGRDRTAVQQFILGHAKTLVVNA